MKLSLSFVVQCAIINLALIKGLAVSGQRGDRELRKTAKRKPAFSLKDGRYADVVRVHPSEKVGEAAFFFTAAHFQITVSTSETECLISKVTLENMPFVSPQYMMHKTFTFQLPLQETEYFFCSNGQEYNEIRGAVTTVCVGEDKVEQEFDEVFKKRVICSTKPPKKLPPNLPPIDPAAYQQNIFHMGIPSTGTSSFHNLIVKLMDELQGSEGKRSVCDTHGIQLAEMSSGQELFDDPTGTTWAMHTGKEGCVYVFGMRPFGDGPQRNYTVMRDPREHVLAQYYHCRESPVSASRREKDGLAPFTATLDEFLQRWVQALVDRRLVPSEFGCFDPRNLQNSYLQVSRPKDLKEKVSFVGLTSRLITSACIEVIQVTGQVPKSCDCSSTEKSRLDIEKYVRIDDGVTTRINSNVTEKQRALLDKLTAKDRALYNEAERLFSEEVAFIEGDFNIRLC